MNRELKLITYNIDGLPPSLDLNDLPWILKPIAWIYKLFKKTTIIEINDNVECDKKTKQIGEFFLNSNADIIGVQENFNYHKELTSELYDHYSWGTHLGGFDISKIFSSVECLTHFPLPRFKADGVNLFTKIGIQTNKEDIVSWIKSYGYISHANDLLTHKGFRLYDLTIDDKYNIDVYVIHTDAAFYDHGSINGAEKDVEARQSQIEQLIGYIINERLSKNINHPMIIMGDINCYDKHPWDRTIVDYLINTLNDVNIYKCEEVIPNNYSDCDKIFIVNIKDADFNIEVKECYFDLTKNGLSDHYPLIATFDIKNNE